MRCGDAVRAGQAVSAANRRPRTRSWLAGPGPARIRRAGGLAAVVRFRRRGPPRLGIGPVILVEPPLIVVALNGLTRSGRLESRWHGSARRRQAGHLAGRPARPTGMTPTRISRNRVVQRRCQARKSRVTHGGLAGPGRRLVRLFRECGSRPTVGYPGFPSLAQRDDQVPKRSDRARTGPGPSSRGSAATYPRSPCRAHPESHSRSLPGTVPDNPEPAGTDQGRPATAGLDPGLPDPGLPDPGRADPGLPDPGRADPADRGNRARGSPETAGRQSRKPGVPADTAEQGRSESDTALQRPSRRSRSLHPAPPVSPGVIPRTAPPYGGARRRRAAT